MQFSLAYLKTAEQIALKQYVAENVEEKLVPFSDIDKISPQVFIFPDQSSSEVIEKLDSVKKFFPVVTDQSLKLSFEHFNNLSHKNALSLYQDQMNKWCLLHNITTIEGIFNITNYLKDLWKNDRHTFFEELWFLVRTNLGTTYLKFIYHDLAQLEEGKEKNKLVVATTDGEKIPEERPGSEGDQTIMQQFSKMLNRSFDIIENQLEKNQMTALARIDEVPIIIMANLPSFNKLQKAVLTALFDGLNEKPNNS